MRFNGTSDIMKLTKNVLVWAVILTAWAAAGAEQPLARLSVRGYADFTNALSRLAGTLNPHEAVDYGRELGQGLGLTNLTGLDTGRPWEIAVWFGGGSQPPLLAIKAPVKDVTRFKENLSPAGLLRAQGRGEWSQLGNGLGLIVFRPADSLSEAEKSALEGWKVEAVAAPKRLVELKLSLSEPIREAAAAGVAFGRAKMSQALTAQNAGGQSGPNPAAIQGMLAAYFEIIDTFIAGLQGFTLGLDLSPEVLTVENTVTAKPGTELAGWLRTPAGQVTAQDLSWVEPGSLLSVAAYIGKEPWLLKLMQKMVRLGLQLQNGENAKTTAARAQIASFKTALDAFEADNGVFPKARNGLSDLVQKPRDAVSWHGPYLAQIPKDPWDQDYIYECPGKHNPASYDISSPGQPGDQTPIGNWPVVQPNSVQLKDFDDLMAKTLPVTVAGSMDLKDKLTFAFSYRFPAASVTETYAQLKRFMTNSLQAFVGKHKMYAAASLTEKDHTINGVPVDRFSFTLNPDNPWLKTAGQKEQLEAFWPEGKLEFDYAIKGDRLLVASADRMKELIEPGNAESNRKPALKLKPGTCLAGYLNLLGFTKQVLAANPAIPQAVKEKTAKLDAQGTGLGFQLRLDNQMHSVVSVPLKLFGELGRLKDN